MIKADAAIQAEHLSCSACIAYIAWKKILLLFQGFVNIFFQKRD